MMLSHIKYCISTWCNGNNQLIAKLQILCNKFIRMIFNLHKRVNTTKIMRQHGLLTIQEMYKLEILTLMYKCNSYKLPTALLHSISHKPSHITRITRSQAKFSIPYCAKTTSQQSIRYIGPKLWSSLPIEIRKMDDLKKICLCCQTPYVYKH